jgi:hypothetical protein
MKEMLMWFVKRVAVGTTIALLLLGVWVGMEVVRDWNAKVNALAARLKVVQQENEETRMLVCHESNLRSSRPQQLSREECTRFVRTIALEMTAMPTPTALELNTTRPGLGRATPTPCDPHYSLCLRR